MKSMISALAGRGLFIVLFVRAAAQCDKGEFWDSVQCLKCPMGRWTDSENTEGAVNCQACPAGRWSNQEGTQSPLDCFECPTGRWAAAEGAAQEDVCIHCSAGRASSVQGSSSFESCELCEPGRFSDFGAGSCSLCYAGSWSDTMGATGNETFSCTPCDAGRFGAEAGKTDASLCITEIILGQGQISSGLDMAIGSMREKEEALIRLSASYAPKRISKDVTDVTFQLELLKFDLVDASSLHRGAQQAIEDLEETPSNENDAEKTVMLGGVPVKMDHLGPVILNDDGSMRRIANWPEMTEHERRVALRRIGQRNQRRLAKLTADL